MQSTLIKQIIYGGFYLAILAGIIYGGYRMVNVRYGTCFDGSKNQNEVQIDCGGDCVPCEIKALLPIQITGNHLIKNSDGTFSILVSLKNPNINYAAATLPFTAKLVGGSGIVGEQSGETVVYAGEIKTLLITSIHGVGAVRGEILLGASEWKSNAEFPKPNIQLRGIRVISEGTKKSIAGFVSNLDSRLVGAVTLFGIFEDGGGLPFVASQTSLTELLPSEEREFRIIFPEEIGNGMEFRLYTEALY
ncbi:MAG: hypothetical protein AAB407_00700 [Patescibacteria group bacterium]